MLPTSKHLDVQSFITIALSVSPIEIEERRLLGDGSTRLRLRTSIETLHTRKQSASTESGMRERARTF